MLCHRGCRSNGVSNHIRWYVSLYVRRNASITFSSCSILVTLRLLYVIINVILFLYGISYKNLLKERKLPVWIALSNSVLKELIYRQINRERTLIEITQSNTSQSET